MIQNLNEVSSEVLKHAEDGYTMLRVWLDVGNREEGVTRLLHVVRLHRISEVVNIELRGHWSRLRTETTPRRSDSITETVQKNVVKEWVAAANTGVCHFKIQERHTHRAMKASNQDSNRYNEEHRFSQAPSPSKRGLQLAHDTFNVVTTVGTTSQPLY